MDYPILYSFRRCPYAMRARLAIQQSGKYVELREVVLKDKPTQMLDISPKATVPVLVDIDGRVIDESLEIMDWALAHTLTDQQQELVKLNDGAFKQALDRYKYYARFDDQEEGKSPLDFRTEALAYLVKYEAYFCENDPSIFDLTVLPFVRQFRGVDELWFDQQALPSLHRRLQAFLQGDSFKNVMKKYTKWQPESSPIITNFREK